MSLPIAVVAPAARRDLDRHVLWLHAEAGPETATRLAKAAIATFAKLALTPGLGTPIPTPDPELAGLRKWRIDGFPDLLFFYRAIPTGIEVLRLLHGSQDWWSLFELD